MKCLAYLRHISKSLRVKGSSDCDAKGIRADGDGIADVKLIDAQLRGGQAPVIAASQSFVSHVCGIEAFFLLSAYNQFVTTIQQLQLLPTVNVPDMGVDWLDIGKATNLLTINGIRPK